MRFVVLLVCLVGSSTARSAVATYSRPKGVEPSDQYAVRVLQDGRAHESFVYMTRRQWRTNRSKTTSWTTFSFSGEVTVAVTKLRGSFRTCRILPSSYGLQAVQRGKTVTFALDRPRKVAVEFDGDITHPMLVFADPPEEDAPSGGGAKLLYFGPGVHDVGKAFRIPPGKSVYLAGGAYVKGTFTCRDRRDLRIRGRGVLSGEDYPHRAAHLIDAGGWNTRGLVVEGITLINSPHYNIALAGRGNIVRNVKMISWWFSTDGVGTGGDGLVEDCFFKVNDDAVKLYHSHMRVRRCVFWQLENGAPFQISWNMPGEHSDFRVNDCDVIRAEHRWKNDNCAVFCSIHGGPGHMSGYVFEDIRIENAPWRLANLLMKRTEFSARHKTFGQISHVTFRNVTVQGAMKLPSTIRGADREHRISDVMFENVKVNGRYLRSAEQANMQIDPRTTRSIRFVVTADAAGGSPPRRRAAGPAPASRN